MVFVFRMHSTCCVCTLGLAECSAAAVTDERTNLHKTVHFNSYPAANTYAHYGKKLYHPKDVVNLQVGKQYNISESMGTCVCDDT